MTNEKFWEDFKEVDSLLKKQAFIQMPGGQSQDKQAQDPSGGMPPPGMDPAAMGAMGGMPPGMDPAMLGAAGGMPPGADPTMMGGDPSAMGMGMPADPSTPEAAPGSPMITISLDQLFEIIQKVLGLAKKVGANGQGVQAQAPAAPAAAPEQQGLTADQLKSTIYEALGSMVG